jgi:hypothetical protein
VAVVDEKPACIPPGASVEMAGATSTVRSGWRVLDKLRCNGVDIRSVYTIEMSLDFAFPGEPRLAWIQRVRAAHEPQSQLREGLHCVCTLRGP